MPDYSTRTHADEWMDDFSIDDERLTGALDNLRFVNALLGGNRALRRALRPAVRAAGGRREVLRVLDLGTGIADMPEMLVRWADRHGARLHVTALDANPVTVDYARAALDRRLPAHLREQVEVVVGDALDLPYETGAFDVATASMFMHHLREAEAVELLREMDRVSRRGLVINDLQRHPLAYHGIRLVSAVLPVSPMFAHDGPLSVLRGFTRDELRHLAVQADLPGARVRWHWAFRWTLSTIEAGE